MSTARVDNYVKTWLPVGLSSEDTDRPKGVTVLNKKLVVWKSEHGWKCADDICPHRAAALSHGKIKNGELTCRFHGWSFNEHGKCSKCPNAVGKLPDIHLSRMYETQEAAGLVFAWFGEKAYDSASDPRPCIPEGATDDASWLVTVPPVSWESMVENSLDPTHAPQLHQGTFFSADSIAMQSFTLDSSDRTGLRLSHSGYTTKNREMNATRKFMAPCLVDVNYEFANKKKQQFPLYFVPRTSSSTTVYAGGLAFLPKPPIFSQFFEELAHIFFFTREALWVFNYQDTHIMLGQDQRRTDFKQAAFNHKNTSPSDAGVSAFYAWLQTYGRPFPASSRDKVSPLHSNSRWQIHGKHCSICSRGLSRLDTIQKRASSLSFFTSIAALANLILDPRRLRLSAAFALFAVIMRGLSSFLIKTRRAFFSGIDPSHELWIQNRVFPATLPAS